PARAVVPVKLPTVFAAAPVRHQARPAVGQPRQPAAQLLACARFPAPVLPSPGGPVLQPARAQSASPACAPESATVRRAKSPVAPLAGGAPPRVVVANDPTHPRAHHADGQLPQRVARRLVAAAPLDSALRLSA